MPECFPKMAINSPVTWNWVQIKTRNWQKYPLLILICMLTILNLDAAQGPGHLG